MATLKRMPHKRKIDPKFATVEETEKAHSVTHSQAEEATELTLDVSSTHNTSQITSDIRIFIK